MFRAEVLKEAPDPTRLVPDASSYQLVAEPELLFSSAVSPTQTVSCVAVIDGATTGEETDIMFETVELHAKELSVTTTE